jgi:hypothetical protein
MHGQERETTRPRRVGRPLAASLAVAAGLLRLLPHPYNLTPVGALGLYGGARLRSWHAYALPLAVMAVTDLLLWRLFGYRPFNPFVYASFLVYVLLGRSLAATESPARIGLASLLASAQFFVLTNFGAWWGSTLYPQTAAGLLACYAAGLPFLNTDAPPLGFFGNLLVGDLGFTAALFGAHAWLSRTAFPAERVGGLAPTEA